MKEFHISKRAREMLDLDDSLFSQKERVIIADIWAARKLAHAYNKKTEKRVSPGEVFVMGIITEILHYVCFLYERDVNPKVFSELLFHLYDRLGRKRVEEIFDLFLEEFPPTSVYTGRVSKKDYLVGKEGQVLEELLLLWLENMNPAFSFLKDLISDENLRAKTDYLKLIRELRNFFDTQRPFGPQNQSLVDMLMSPALHEPDSLEGQLRYILENWGYLLGDLILKLKSGFDTLKEEKVFFFPCFFGAHIHYDYTYKETEPLSSFPQEAEWMRNLVLVAKNTYVWLSQLSKKYGRDIRGIDEIPDEELKKLRDWGINGLWLIGIWERSPASKKIKNLCGNEEAIASAYSIYDYKISQDLGGEDAYETLRKKAKDYGIRIGCDMVPNHMGIDSKWMIDRPKWFIYRLDNPYPWYTFSSHNLSSHPNLEIYIEDHYYDRTDAAVVCKRVDRVSGEVLYIYHGNDGTGMPWNDTIQINYLIPEVREAMIETILQVSKKFPIIRFDAAMTLTKMHYQRLWFPEPGGGGAIPTRSEFAMTKEEFDRHMPNEFWREVVERVRKEAPETLLIAEAFWLLEGYFVKNLGIHRVYNSAFMHMLRDENNERYRELIKKILKTDPWVLERFVNFMNNPDEKTAYEQFGNGDKYFCICTMMVSLPGLPMFGHGQIEGLKEKYGMEFKKPYLDEEPDVDFVKRHENEIFPILRKRYLFSRTEDFFLYDFLCEDGKTDEDVFAFSNSYGEERALIVCHNKEKKTEGWIRDSVPRAEKNGDEITLTKKTLCEALRISEKEGYYTIFKDERNGSEYVYENGELTKRGMYLKLGPYQSLAFLRIEEVKEDDLGVLRTLVRIKKGEPLGSVEASYEFTQDFLKLANFEREVKKSELDEIVTIFSKILEDLSRIEGREIKREEVLLSFRQALEDALKIGPWRLSQLVERIPFFPQKDRDRFAFSFLIISKSVSSVLSLFPESDLIRSLLSLALKVSLSKFDLKISDTDPLSIFFSLFREL